jgi:hypothetical protein
MAEVKGVLVTGTRAFLLSRYGRAETDKALHEIDPQAAALIDKRFLDSSFYPYETMNALAVLIRSLAPIHRTTGQELGTFLAEYVFKGAYKPMLDSDMPRMVTKIATIKDFFYRDANTVESDMTGDSSCKVVYRYAQGVQPTRGACRSLGAFWGRVLELAGGVAVVDTHPICVAEGDDRCEFRYSW